LQTSANFPPLLKRFSVALILVSYPSKCFRTKKTIKDVCCTCASSLLNAG
jgi:hypothetical protein